MNSSSDKPILDLRKFKINGRVYMLQEYIDKGGSGFVYKATGENLDGFLAVKFFFPFHQLELFATLAMEQVAELQQKEYDFLRRVRHPNMQRLVDTGYVELRPNEQKRAARLVPEGHLPKDGVSSLPVLVSEWVEGARSK
jgi:serine/threonine protein kinase